MICELSPEMMNRFQRRNDIGMADVVLMHVQLIEEPQFQPFELGVDVIAIAASFLLR
jgi:hypothetical protein